MKIFGDIIFSTTSIQIGTKWEEARSILLNNPKVKEIFENVKKSSIIEEYFTKIDLLDAFAKSMAKYDEEDENKRKDANIKAFRNERINRDNFRVS